MKNILIFATLAAIGIVVAYYVMVDELIHDNAVE
jgi:hypothetical protein